MDSRSPLDGRPYYENTDRFRLTVDAQESIFRAHVDWDQELISGTYFRTEDYKLFGLGEPPTWLDMTDNIDQTATSLWRQKIYRGWAGLDGDKGTLRFGRQRIAWGTGKLWNPTDVLNPYQPTTVEPDERRGVDSAYGRLNLGELSQAELAYAPQSNWSGSSLLARGHTNLDGYDVSLMGGKVGFSTAAWMAGGDFAGNLYDGTLHGEWSYVDEETRTPFWRADLGWDYSFASDSRLSPLKDSTWVFEYFHNGGGQTNTNQYNFGDLLTGQEIALAQDYLGVTVSKDLNPLWKLGLTCLTNVTDGSQFASPSLQYNVLQNLYLTASAQRFGGPKRTEFGRPANISYVQAQYFF